MTKVIFHVKYHYIVYPLLLRLTEISSYKDSLVQRLPELYENEESRRLVEIVLIPFFWKKVEEIIGEQAITHSNLREICTAIDRVIVENRSMLDVDDLFKPVLIEINAIREQIKRQILETDQFDEHRQVLKAMGINYGGELAAMNSGDFKQSNFGGFGHGYAFASSVLGQGQQITKPVIAAVAEKLFPEESVEEAYLFALAAHDIHNSFDLELFGSEKFIATDFGIFGKGRAFAAIILGEGRAVGSAVIEDIGKKYFPK